VKYRLPTEAEWEYACRAGSQSRWCMGDDPTRLVDFAWIGANAGYVTHPVGLKRPNAFGLYDMHGNVWEWCKDYYAPGYLPDAVDDPKGPTEGHDHVLRGGSWDHPEGAPTRSAERLHHPPSFCYYTIGFRVRRAILPTDAAPRSP
jgi:formylglycine-generating enzyme required for sulfatase activity